MDSSKRDTSHNRTLDPSDKQEVGPDTALPTAVPHTTDGHETLPPAPKPVVADGRVIRGYRLLEVLGKGAFGVVYKALSSGGVTVAIKEIKYLQDNPLSKRELDALELIKGLRHPYLLSMHDFWIEGDRLYVVMDLADATLHSLAAKHQAKEIPQSELVRVFGEAAAALDYLHQQRVLHRDIKPANILLLAGYAKIADLGLAKHNPNDAVTSMTFAGTPGYMAPETFGNVFRPESDQYALALCYAELRLGRRICDATNIQTAVFWHVSGAANLKGLKPHEEKAVRRALSKEPAERFASCQKFVQALHDPKPGPPGPDNRSLYALAILLTIPLLALLVWYFIGPPVTTPPAPPQPLPSAKWLAEHGFRKHEDAKLTTVGGKQYYDRIVKDIDAIGVVFVLIPDKPQPFYIMEYKVTNGMFKAAAANEKFQKLINGEKQLEQDYFKQLPEDQKDRIPNLKMTWGEWTKGGLIGGEDLGAQDDDIPVFRVNVLEASCFARWLGGNLPKEEQWDLAGGKELGVKAPFENPDLKLEPDDVAVDREAKGPMKVGKAKRDRSFYGCWDMAGNGMEWTRNLNHKPTPLVPPNRDPRQLKPSDLDFLQVAKRGHSYRDEKPYFFAEESRWIGFKETFEDVGFRVVVEPDE